MSDSGGVLIVHFPSVSVHGVQHRAFNVRPWMHGRTCIVRSGLHACFHTDERAVESADRSGHG